MSDLNRVTATILQMDWRTSGDLITNKDGNLRPLLSNALIALRRDEAWSGVLAFNDFAVKIETQAATPWGKPAGEQWTDNDDRLTAEWLQQQGILVSSKLAGEAVQTVAFEHRFHPVRDYLNSLQWDGEPRLDKWVNRYLEADYEKEILRTFGRMWLISAVARIFEPGCQADHCLVLEGEQGIGKSTALRILAGDWFTDHMPDLGSKDSLIQIHGVWIVELAELDSVNRADVSRTKAFLTAVSDRFRLPYGTHAVAWPRDCVFAGTTNRDDYNRDETGGRRLWPVRCHRIDVEGLQRDRDQLWAEAVERYREGAHWWLKDAASIAAAEQEQAERFAQDPWAEKISDYIFNLAEVSVGQILRAIGKPDGQWNRSDEMRVSAFLKSRGWTQFRTEVGSKQVRMYRSSQ